MSTLRAAAVAGISLFLAHVPAAGQNRLLAEIPIELAHNKTIVPVTVGGSTLRLILDSGMPYDGVLVFDTAKVDLTRFPSLVQARIGGAGQGDGTPALHDPTAGFSIGSMSFDGQSVIVLATDIYKGFPNDGVIGYSVLGHYAVELDYGARRMRLYEAETFSPEAGWASVDLYFKDNRVPWMDLRVATAGEPPVVLATYIDFASGEALELLEREINAFRMPATAGERLVGRGLSGDIYGKEGRVPRILVGPFALEDVAVMVTPAAVRSKQEGADAVVGNGLLSRFDMIFDYAHGKLHVRPRGPGSG
ncbi:MAG TPA: hypothetical protein VLH75_06330 [Longimicrobiales bacterium]|nr:hypothetical protein [Longimicrobiales bacterium]